MRIGGKLLLIFTYLAAFALLLSYSAAFISPVKLWLPAFFGLAYPFILIANLIFLVFWLIKRKRYVFAPLLMLLLGWNYPGRFFQLGSADDSVKKAEEVKILSYNVQTFQGFRGTAQPAELKVFDFLKEQQADVLCLQEFFYSPGQFNAIHRIKADLDMPYHYMERYSDRNKHYAMVVFSKYKILDHGEIDHPLKREFAMFTDLKIGIDTVRLINVHLQSTKLSAQKNIFAENININNPDDQQMVKNESRKMARKLKVAFQQHAIQANYIHDFIKKSPHEVILCGDFNDTPASFAYRKIRKGLQDAFVEGGVGSGKTYRGKYPSFRIDYILLSDAFEVKSFHTLQEKFSDHNPVCCIFAKEE